MKREPPALPTLRLDAVTALLLTMPPLLWAGNAIVGRLLAPHVPPITLNLLRWVIVVVLLLPFGWRLLQLRSQALVVIKPLMAMGLLGIGCYNALQYMALQTSTPMNVTLVAASTPVWMMIVGAVFFAERIRGRQLIAALFSMAGVVVVLCAGDWQRLTSLRLVPGDVLMLLAAMSWAGYSWLLMRTPLPEALRKDWAAFLLAQVLCGLIWCALSTALEWTLAPRWGFQPHITWSAPVMLGLLFVALGPALLAYRCWGLGVGRAGPTVAAFFANLTPLFAATMSALMLGESPRAYHALAFALIVVGIAVSSRR